MTDFNALIEQLGFGFRTAPCGIAAAAREAKPPLMTPRMIPGRTAAAELGQQPIDFARHDPQCAGDFDVADLKVDGIRGHYLDGMIVSREGTPLNCARHCLTALQRLEDSYGYKMFFDGEYLEPGGFTATNAAFKRGEGDGVFWLFDAVPFAEWVRNQGSQSVYRRRAHLLAHAKQAASPHVGVLRLLSAEGYAESRALAVRAWQAGLEGIVVKNRDGVYSRCRSPNWRRLKQLDTVDGTIVDVLQHPSADGTPAIVMVRTPGGPIKVTLAGKSGWNRPLEGQVVEIAFNQTEDGKPRHARFVRFRDDKEVRHA
jgi:ATP-dependent DNA ligase